MAAAGRPLASTGSLLSLCMAAPGRPLPPAGPGVVILEKSIGRKDIWSEALVWVLGVGAFRAMSFEVGTAKMQYKRSLVACMGSVLYKNC